MPLYEELETRCESKCELCSSTNELSAFTVQPKSGDLVSEQIAVCATCNDQLENDDNIDANHWRCLNDSMWNPEPAVQVVAFRMLNKLNKEGWAEDLIGMIYMEDETRKWAEIGNFKEEAVIHKDSNGVVLQAGDSVTLIKDLKVKGASFIAKRGTAVRRISLIHDNANHIQGKVEGQTIIILTEFVKKN